MSARAPVVTAHGFGREYCVSCGHDRQYHASHRVVSTGALSTTPVCHRDSCACGHHQKPRVEL